MKGESGKPNEKESRLDVLQGAKVVTRKSLEAKRLMQKYSKDFGGILNDIDTMTQIRARVDTLSRNS